MIMKKLLTVFSFALLLFFFSGCTSDQSSPQQKGLFFFSIEGGTSPFVNFPIEISHFTFHTADGRSVKVSVDKEVDLATTQERYLTSVKVPEGVYTNLTIYFKLETPAILKPSNNQATLSSPILFDAFDQVAVQATSDLFSSVLSFDAPQVVTKETKNLYKLNLDIRNSLLKRYDPLKMTYIPKGSIEPVTSIPFEAGLVDFVGEQQLRLLMDTIDEVVVALDSVLVNGKMVQANKISLQQLKNKLVSGVLKVDRQTLHVDLEASQSDKYVGSLYTINGETAFIGKQFTPSGEVITISGHMPEVLLGIECETGTGKTYTIDKLLPYQQLIAYVGKQTRCSLFRQKVKGHLVGLDSGFSLKPAIGLYEPSFAELLTFDLSSDSLTVSSGEYAQIDGFFVKEGQHNFSPYAIVGLSGEPVDLSLTFDLNRQTSLIGALEGEVFRLYFNEQEGIHVFPKSIVKLNKEDKLIGLELSASSSIKINFGNGQLMSSIDIQSPIDFLQTLDALIDFNHYKLASMEVSGTVSEGLLNVEEIAVYLSPPLFYFDESHQEVDRLVTGNEWVQMSDPYDTRLASLLEGNYYPAISLYDFPNVKLNDDMFEETLLLQGPKWKTFKRSLKSAWQEKSKPFRSIASGFTRIFRPQAYLDQVNGFGIDNNWGEIHFRNVMYRYGDSINETWVHYDDDLVDPLDEASDTFVPRKLIQRVATDNSASFNKTGFQAMPEALSQQRRLISISDGKYIINPSLFRENKELERWSFTLNNEWSDATPAFGPVIDRNDRKIDGNSWYRNVPIEDNADDEHPMRRAAERLAYLQPVRDLVAANNGLVKIENDRVVLVNDRDEIRDKVAQISWLNNMLGRPIEEIAEGLRQKAIAQVEELRFVKHSDETDTFYKKRLQIYMKYAFSDYEMRIVQHSDFFNRVSSHQLVSFKPRAAEFQHLPNYFIDLEAFGDRTDKMQNKINSVEFMERMLYAHFSSEERNRIVFGGKSFSEIKSPFLRMDAYGSENRVMFVNKLSDDYGLIPQFEILLNDSEIIRPRMGVWPQITEKSKAYFLEKATLAGNNPMPLPEVKNLNVHVIYNNDLKTMRAAYTDYFNNPSATAIVIMSAGGTMAQVLEGREVLARVYGQVEAPEDVSWTVHAKATLKKPNKYVNFLKLDFMRFSRVKRLSGFSYSDFAQSLKELPSRVHKSLVDEEENDVRQQELFELSEQGQKRIKPNHFVLATPYADRAKNAWYKTKPWSFAHLFQSWYTDITGNKTTMESYSGEGFYNEKGHFTNNYVQEKVLNKKTNKVEYKDKAPKGWTFRYSNNSSGMSIGGGRQAIHYNLGEHTYQTPDKKVRKFGR